MGLLEIVGDDRLELGHRRQLALDDVAATLTAGGVVHQAYDTQDALAVDDALAGADGVAGELDALIGLPGAPRLGDGRGGHGRPPFQVALDSYPVVSMPSMTRAASPRRAMSSCTARISRR